MTGYVYFIRCRDRVKIGFSKNPRSRLTKINADAPYPCTLIGYADASAHPEKRIHEKFKAYRVHSEWFLASHELLEFVESVSVSDGEVSADKFSRANIDAFPPLKAWRYRNRMVLADAAARLGVSPAFLSRVERGDYHFAPERIQTVERITGISRHELRPDIFGPVPQPTPTEGAAA